MHNLDLMNYKEIIGKSEFQFATSTELFLPSR